MLVTAALGYTVLTLAAQVYWGVERWTRHGEAFAVYYNMFARMSIFETRDGVLGVRRPLGGLPQLDVVRRAPSPFVTRDDRHRHVRRALPGPAVEGPVGERRRRARRPRDRRADRDQDRRDRRAAARRVPRRRLLPARHRGRALGRRRALASSKLEYGFIHSLVPIAAVYVAAHYLTFLVFEGQAITYLASRPVRAGLGPVRHRRHGIDYTVFPQEDTWYVQVAVVVIGHVAALRWPTTGR